ncbi:radical SAM protein [Streptomyces arboris]|uniref:radical SAM protein n=1 Tax=Streptomyces arboris TaxID=2600619 RepID=UPI003643C6E3
MAPFEDVKHSVQTNAALIDDAWCEFLLEHQVRVGVSIDGPEDMNTHRLTLAGRPGFRVIMRGMERLRRHGIPFSAIAVVSNPDPDRASRFYGFFADLGVTTLGVNVEEEEGVNLGAKDADPVQAAEFWTALADAWRRTRWYGCARCSGSSTSPGLSWAVTPRTRCRPSLLGTRCPPSPTTAA